MKMNGIEVEASAIPYGDARMGISTAGMPEMKRALDRFLDSRGISRGTWNGIMKKPKQEKKHDRH